MVTKPLELSEAIHKQINDLCKDGDALASAGRPEEAKQKYISALKLLPGEPNQWEVATWIYVAIGDVHFHSRNFDRAFKCFYDAVQCPQGLGNPYIHLRLGQLYFEQNNFDKATDELTRAYMGGGINLFMEDDPKYLEFLETNISL